MTAACSSSSVARVETATIVFRGLSIAMGVPLLSYHIARSRIPSNTVLYLRT